MLVMACLLVPVMQKACHRAICDGMPDRVPETAGNGTTRRALGCVDLSQWEAYRPPAFLWRTGT